MPTNTGNTLQQFALQGGSISDVSGANATPKVPVHVNCILEGIVGNYFADQAGANSIDFWVNGTEYEDAFVSPIIDDDIGFYMSPVGLPALGLELVPGDLLYLVANSDGDAGALHVTYILRRR
jgi:hypothetical protein